MQNKQRLDEKVYKDMSDRLTSDEGFVNLLVVEQLNYEKFDTERIVEGLGNEVYKVIPEQGDTVILRIHHGKYEGFYLEEWAMTEASKQGVLVPNVIAVGEEEYRGKIYTYCFLSMLEGVSLSEILNTDTGDETIRRYGLVAGATLAKLHKVSTKGFGHFKSHGIAKHSTFVESLQQHGERNVLVDVARESTLEASDIDKIIGIIDSANTEESSHLVHVDFAPKHLFFKDGELTGVIDWEICMSHVSAVDINRWRSQDNRIPMRLLLEGYETVTKLPESFWETMYIIQLHSALRTILYHHNVTKSKKDILIAAEEAKNLLNYGEAVQE